jgi:hypothetical protein
LWLQLSFGAFKMFVANMKHIKRKMFPVLLVLWIYGLLMEAGSFRGVLSGIFVCVI